MNPDADGGIAPPVAPPGEPVHWLVRPRTVRGLWIGFALILAGLVLGDLLVHGHPGFGIDGTFGFYAWYGLGTCVAMVLVAKALGLGLKRPDTYYGPGLDGGPGAGGASAGKEAGGEAAATAREGGSRTADPAGRQEKPAATNATEATEAAAVEAAGSGRAAGDRKTVEAAPEERAVAGESANAASSADAAETKGAGGSGG